MITEKAYKKALLIVETYRSEKGLKNFTGIDKNTRFIDAGVSQRLYNILNYYFEYLDTDKLIELEKLSFSEFKGWYKVGKRTVDELKNLCDQVGIKMRL